MKTRWLSNILIVIGLLVCCYFFLSTSTLQFNLSLVVGLGLLGIMLMDEQNQISSHLASTSVFALTALGLLVTINQSTKENFFLMLGGVNLILNLFAEKESDPWQGSLFSRTPLVANVVFFGLVIIECMPYLMSQVVLVLDVLALCVLNVQELLTLKRANSNQWAGSFHSSLRILTNGVASYVYGQVFLPEIASQSDVFTFLCLGFAALGLVLALLSLLQKNVALKHTIFTSAWGLLLLWGGLQKNSVLIVAGAMFASWTLISYRARFEDLIPKFFAFACPGTLLFVVLVGILLPTEAKRIQLDMVLWSSAFIIFWLGLTRTTYKNSLGWRQGFLAVLTSSIIAVFFSGMDLAVLKEKF